MDQRSPRVEVQGKNLPAGAERGRRLEAHSDGTAAKTGRSKAPIAVVGTSIGGGKKAASGVSEGSAVASLPVHVPRTGSPPRQQPSHSTAADKGKPPSTSTSPTVAAAAAAHGNRAIEISLLRNLKQQIACLEAQLRVSRQKQEATARTHTRRPGRSEVEAAGASTADAHSPHDAQDRSASGVALPLPHRERVCHFDAVVGLHATDPREEDGDVHRLRRFPDAYQVERSALQHNVESLNRDVEGLQSLALTVGRERDVMAAEVVQYRAALRASQVEHTALIAECEVSLRLLEAERALRRAAEDDVAACARGNGISGGVGGGSSPGVSICAESATADAVSQRNYYRLQSDRMRASVAREKARADTFAAALLQERGRGAALEKQLCGALDRVGLMEKRERQLAGYYQSLSARFVTMSAMLRHVLDVVPEDLLQQQHQHQEEEEEHADIAAVADEGLTFGQVRETLTVWRDGVLANMAQLKALIGEAATESTTEVTNSREAAPPPAAQAEVQPATAPPLSPLPLTQPEASPPPPTGTTTESFREAMRGSEEVEEERMAAAALRDASVSSEPDMMAIATVATITQIAEGGLDMLQSAKKMDKVERGILAAAQEHGDAAAAATPAAGVCVECAVSGDAAEPSSSPPGSPPALYAGVPSLDAEKPTPAGEVQAGAVGADPVAEGKGALRVAPDLSPAIAATSAPEATKAHEKAAVIAAEIAPTEEVADAPTARPLPMPSLATAPESSSEGDEIVASPLEQDGAASPPSPLPSTEVGAVAEAAPTTAVEPEDGGTAPAAVPGAASPEDLLSTAVSVGEGVDIVGVVDSPAQGEAITVADDAIPAAEAPAVEAPSVPSPPLPPLVSAVPLPSPPPPSFTVPVPSMTTSVPLPPRTTPTFTAIPVTLPPGGVSVPPPPPASTCVPMPPPPVAVVPTSGPPAAPTPPTLEEQLAQLDARIEAQNSSLADLVLRYKAES